MYEDICSSFYLLCFLLVFRTLFLQKFLLFSTHVCFLRVTNKSSKDVFIIKL
jgi:hypothetical protein